MTIRRVLSLSTLFPNAANPRFGTFVARSLEALQRETDWDVTLVNPIGLPPLPGVLLPARYRMLAEATVDGIENGVSVYRPRFPLLPMVGGRFNPRAIARAVLPLIRDLHAKTPFDLIDAQFFYPDGPAAARIAQALGLPLSIKARGADIHFWGAKSYGREAMLAAGSQASGLLAVCDALAQDMAALGLSREKIALHHTGLDRDRFRPFDHTRLRARVAKELDVAIADTDKLLVTVGALIPRKGQRLTIEALTALPEARLLLVGKGEDEADLRTLVQERGLGGRVHFLGSLDHDLLPLVLSAADAMVLPSSSEGLANAWVEALACGTPLVITDAGGAREVVDGPEAGIIVAREPGAIAEGVRLVLANPHKPHVVAQKAERFDWRINGRALAAYYDRILDAPLGD